MSYDERTVVAHVKRVKLKDLRIWVREGWVRPAQSDTGPIFDEVDIARIRLLCDLKTDMSLPSDALPIVLTLLDRLHQTRRELRTLTEAMQKQPEEVRVTIIDTFREMSGSSINDNGER